MNRKKIKAKEIEISTKIGTIKAKNIEVEVYNCELSSDNFDPKKHDYIISSKIIEKHAIRIAKDFYETNVINIYLLKKKLTADEVSGIRMVLNIDGSQLALLLGVNKGTISKILAAKINMKTPETIILMNYLRMKVENPEIDFSDLVQKFKNEEKDVIRMLSA
jgi:DNA-binding transcriptional regulator YiaG